MTEQATLTQAKSANVEPESQREYRSGVYAKGKRDGSGGWGLVLVGLDGEPRALPLLDGAVVGSASSDAEVKGVGVAPQHARVVVRADGCYFEDLGSQEGTFVGGVRAQRINVAHGDVVRLGRQLAVFVERDLVTYGEAPRRSGSMVHGAKQYADWVAPVLDLVKSGSSVCIEGPPGTGKRTLARLAASSRQAVGEVFVIDARSTEPLALPPSGVKPKTWIVLDADRLPRSMQLEVAHAVSRSSDVSAIVTMNQPLDRAAGDGLVAPWFAALFSGRRVVVPSLEARREDIPLLLADLAARWKIPAERFGADLLEGLLRAGWPSGVPQIEEVVAAAVAASPAQGPLLLSSIASSLARPNRAKPNLPPATDPSLARARLEDALARANGSVAAAARSLGMSRQAIYREADRLGLDIARRRSPRAR